MDANIIAFCYFIGVFIDGLIKAECIAAVEFGITVFFVRKDIFKDHFRNFVDDIGIVDIFAFDFPVDFLFFVGQEYIGFAIFLYQHLADQDFKSLFDVSLQGNPVFFKIIHHEGRNIIDIRRHVLYVFDKEQCFQYVDSKNITGLVIRVDIVIFIGFDDDAAMAVVEEIFHRRVEGIKRDNRALLFMHIGHCRLFEHGQHGAFPFGQMLAGSTVGTDSGQDGTKQIELIRDKRINGGKIVCSCVQFAFYRVGEDNLVLDGRFFLAVQETQRLGGSIIFFEDTFFDDRIDIGGRQGQTGIKAALDFGEIVAFDFDNGIDILLGCDNDPGFAIAGAAQIFGHGLQVEHEIAVVTDILADFIDEEHDMMVMTFFVDILFDAASKFFDRDAIGLGSFLTPVPY